jgi:putative addiction module antidote
MVATVKLRKQGGSLAVTLPKEIVREMGVRAGGSVHLVQVGPGEYRLTPYDPAFRRAMQVYERGAAKYRNALRELAK